MQKLCRYCGKSYPESDFGVAATLPNKIYRRQKCRYCYRDTKKLLFSKYRVWLEDYKKERRCINCGTDDFRVLDFHHNGNGSKEFNISEFARFCGFEKLKKEVEKCILLCANCHRIVHYKAGHK